MLSTHFRTACVIYFQMPFYIGNNSQDASATSPFCCVAAACQTPGGSNMPRTVSQDAEHRVRCVAFALFFFFFFIIDASKTEGGVIRPRDAPCVYGVRK